MSNTLLPCPFCWGEAGLTSRYIGYGSVGLGAHDWFTVVCKKCRAKSNEYGEKEEAIAAWNRRTEQESELPASSTPTNAQRIRGMSDEELQKFLRKFESGDIDYAKTFCDFCCKDAALERRSVDCDGCLLWWLKNDAKQPQEGEGK